MKVRYTLAVLALVLSLLTTGCGTTGCSRCGGSPTVAQAVPISPVPVAPSPAPCCGGNGPAAPVAVQPSYSIPVYPSNAYRP